MAYDEENKILENRIKIIEEERKHYMEEIEKSKEEAMELIKKKELIEKQNGRLKEEASRQAEQVIDFGKKLGIYLVDY